MLTLALSLSSPAHAGKLADGFRGLAFGPASVLDQPPQPQGCIAGETTTRWLCVVEINGVATEVAYIAAEGWFYSVQIQPPRNYMAAAAVFAALTAAYGPCAKDQYASGVLPKCSWTDGSDGQARALWDYNRFSEESTVTIFHRDVYGNVEAIRKQRAAQAAEGL